MPTLTSSGWTGSNPPLQPHQLNPNCKNCKTHQNTFGRLSQQLYEKAMQNAQEQMSQQNEANGMLSFNGLQALTSHPNGLGTSFSDMERAFTQMMGTPSVRSMRVPTNREAVIPLDGSVLGAQEILAQVPGQITMFIATNASLVLIDNREINGQGNTIISISPQVGERSSNRFATPLPFTTGLVAIAKRLNRNRPGNICISYQVYE